MTASAWVYLCFEPPSDRTLSYTAIDSIICPRALASWWLGFVFRMPMMVGLSGASLDVDFRVFASLAWRYLEPRRVSADPDRPSAHSTHRTTSLSTRR